MFRGFLVADAWWRVARVTRVTLVRVKPGRVWRLTLARPDAGNAVSAPMLGELLRGLEESAADSEARLVLLAGEGRHFCAGADIDELDRAAGEARAADYGRALERVLEAMGEHPLPILAVTHGAALGAGCQLVLAADLAIAATDARLGIPSARLGVVLTFETVQRLVLSVGPKRAADLLLSARTLSGEEAAAWGLISEAVPPEELAARAEDLADRVEEGAPISVRASKRGIREVLSRLSVDRATEGFRVADFDAMAALAFESEDLREGIAAFRERRDPEFRGR